MSLFICFLLIAGAIGIYFGLKKHSAIARGIYWAQKTHLLAQQPSPVPQFETTEEKMQAAARKWYDFKRASRKNEAAEVELSADDLNNLIAKDGRTRGKAFVRIENDHLHVQTSVPLAEYIGRSGYYVNGDVVIQTSGPQSLDDSPLNRISVNGEPLPSDLLRWNYRSRPLRDHVARYRGKLNIDTFEIRDGKLILRKTSR